MPGMPHKQAQQHMRLLEARFRFSEALAPLGYRPWIKSLMLSRAYYESMRDRTLNAAKLTLDIAPHYTSERTAHRLVNRLIADGYLAWRKNDGKLLFITDKGRRFIENLNDTSIEAVRRVFAVLGILVLLV